MLPAQHQMVDTHLSCKQLNVLEHFAANRNVPQLLAKTKKKKKKQIKEKKMT